MKIERRPKKGLAGVHWSKGWWKRWWQLEL